MALQAWPAPLPCPEHYMQLRSLTVTRPSMPITQVREVPWEIETRGPGGELGGNVHPIPRDLGKAEAAQAKSTQILGWGRSGECIFRPPVLTLTGGRGPA